MILLVSTEISPTTVANAPQRGLMRSICIAGSFLLLVNIVGCGGDDATRSSLTGSVQFNDLPVADGRITLLPLKPDNGEVLSSPIVNGTYEFVGENAPQVGGHRVEIEGFRKTGKTIRNLASPERNQAAPPSAEEVIPYIPPQFNLQTNLRVEVGADSTTRDFDLHTNVR